MWRSEGLSVPCSCEGRLVRFDLYVIKNVPFLPACDLQCERQKGLAVFVSTPRLEHTCNFLSIAMSHSFKHVSSQAASSFWCRHCGLVVWTAGVRLEKIIHSFWMRFEPHLSSWLWLKWTVGVVFVFVWALSSVVAITGATWHQLFISQLLQRADGGAPDHLERNQRLSAAKAFAQCLLTQTLRSTWHYWGFTALGFDLTHENFLAARIHICLLNMKLY